MYDCAIIGAGPAGLSAAINLRLHNINYIWFGTPALSDKISSAEKIANYPGLPMVSGKQLQSAFLDHIREMDLSITDKMVTLITAAGDSYMLLADNEVYQAKSIILATGVIRSKLITGEEEFIGRGVSYCATCDGFLYKDKTIAVLCKSKRFEHEAEYLASLAQKMYYLPEYKNPSISGENVFIVKEKCVAINGTMKVDRLTLKDGSSLFVDGFFILRDAITPTTLLPGLVVEKGHISVDRNMSTNLPGCFACGDCTGTPYQYAKAIGEGNIAAHSVIKYLR